MSVQNSKMIPASQDIQIFIDGERWEVIAGGYYAVSDHGRLMRTASGKASVAGKIKSLRLNQMGYDMAGLSIGCEHKNLRVHIAVAAAFIGPCPPKHEVNHKDGNKLNNHWTNLEYVTHRENGLHAHHTGLKKCKLSESDLVVIRERLANGEKQTHIAADYNVSSCTISNIALGKSRVIRWENQ